MRKKEYEVLEAAPLDVAMSYLSKPFLDTTNNLCWIYVSQSQIRHEILFSTLVSWCQRFTKWFWFNSIKSWVYILFNYTALWFPPIPAIEYVLFRSVSSCYVLVRIYFWGTVVNCDEPISLDLISDATFSWIWHPMF